MTKFLPPNWRADRERGSVSLELAVVFPAVLALVFIIVQAGVYYHGRTLAGVAAQEGLKVATARTGTQSAGTGAARDFLSRSGADGWLTNQQVDTTRSANEATVVVVGRSISLVPGVPGLVVRQSASGPVERPTQS